jgi:hypothetical protein
MSFEGLDLKVLAGVALTHLERKAEGHRGLKSLGEWIVCANKLPPLIFLLRTSLLRRQKDSTP